MYACASCPVWAAIEALDTENFRAWQQFQQAFSRLAVEQQMVGVVFQRLAQGLSDEEFEAVLTRWSILYDVYYPSKRRDAHGA